MPKQEPPTWEAVQTRLPDLLNELKSCPALVRDSPGRLFDIPKQGIYAFYEDGRPRYVGRSDRMRTRIFEHGRAGSRHNSATFVFLLATEEAHEKGIDCTARTRDDLQQADDFKPLYDEAKARVRRMEFRVVEIADPIEKWCSKSTLHCACPPSVLTGTTISRTTDNGAIKPQYAE